MDSDEEELKKYERDLFGDDEDEDDGGGDAADSKRATNENRRRSGDEDDDRGSIKSDNEEAGAQFDNEKDKDEKTGQKVKPKKKGPVQHQLLSEDVLCGPNGLIKIEQIFKDFKFEGKGREMRDLDRLLHNLEHWAHIMYPRHPFGQTLERMEFLGLKKRSVKTYVKKIRMGLITNVDPEVDELLRLDENDISSDEEGGENEETRPRPVPLHTDGGDEIPSDDDFPFLPDEELDAIDAMYNASTSSPPVPARENSDPPSPHADLQESEINGSPHSKRNPVSPPPPTTAGVCQMEVEVNAIGSD